MNDYAKQRTEAFIDFETTTGKCQYKKLELGMYNSVQIISQKVLNYTSEL